MNVEYLYQVANASKSLNCTCKMKKIAEKIKLLTTDKKQRKIIIEGYFASGTFHRKSWSIVIDARGSRCPSGLR